MKKKTSMSEAEMAISHVRRAMRKRMESEMDRLAKGSKSTQESTQTRNCKTCNGTLTNVIGGVVWHCHECRTFQRIERE